MERASIGCSTRITRHSSRPSRTSFDPLAGTWRSRSRSTSAASAAASMSWRSTPRRNDARRRGEVSRAGCSGDAGRFRSQDATRNARSHVSAAGRAVALAASWWSPTVGRRDGESLLTRRCSGARSRTDESRDSAGSGSRIRHARSRASGFCQMPAWRAHVSGSTARGRSRVLNETRRRVPDARLDGTSDNSTADLCPAWRELGNETPERPRPRQRPGRPRRLGARPP